jgi:hypothetical protein
MAVIKINLGGMAVIKINLGGMRVIFNFLGGMAVICRNYKDRDVSYVLYIYNIAI